MRRSLLLLVPLTLALACKDEPKKDTTCTLGDDSTCSGGQVCESVVGGEPACTAPVVIRGQVFDADTLAGIAGAVVVALDVNGSAVTGTVTTDATGHYELRIPVSRDADGNLVGYDITLRVGADGYLQFPRPPRYAVPVGVGGAVDEDGTFVVDTTGTDVALLPLPTSSTPTGSISGTVTGDGVAGGLVVAVQGGVAVATAIVDTDGSYVLFNVPQGSTTIQVYRAGVVVDPIVVDLDMSQLEGQDLAVNTGVATGTVTGSLNFVDASGGDPQTTVILVPLATFDAETVRGEAPAGLRVVVPTSGANFTVTGVPPGDYVVLAAFENDNLVRDPDENQGGTAVLTITVAAGQTVDAGSFKITGALTLTSPGGTAPETITDTTPTFSWLNDPSSDLYELRLYDAYGTPVYENATIPAGSGNQPVSFDLPQANALEVGMTYQWRLFSIDTQGNTYISASEDLEGVFTVGAAN